MFQITLMYPEMAENLASSISNDLTYNLKSSSWYKIDNKLNTPSYMAEKEVQTNESEEAMKESEIREYILSHKSEVLAILGVSENGLKPHNLSATYPVSPSGSTNSVKFKFDKDMMSFSPTNTLDSSKSRKRSVSPKKILKKQSSQNIPSLLMLTNILTLKYLNLKICFTDPTPCAEILGSCHPAVGGRLSLKLVNKEG